MIIKKCPKINEISLGQIALTLDSGWMNVFTVNLYPECVTVITVNLCPFEHTLSVTTAIKRIYYNRFHWTVLFVAKTRVRKILQTLAFNFVVCCSNKVHWCNNDTGELPMFVANNTLNSCSFCIGFSINACIRATDENQFERTSEENKPPQRSWPLVKVDISVEDGSRVWTREAWDVSLW